MDNLTIPLLNLFDGSWIHVRDGHKSALHLFQRHYSRYIYKDGRQPTRFVGPGERIVLITHDGKAMFVWRKFKDASGQQGVNCAVFRNESKILSSVLINEAVKIAWLRWPGERLYTYVNPRKIISVNPGYCFKIAGWKTCGITKTRKLIVLEKIPNGFSELGRAFLKTSQTAKVN